MEREDIERLARLEAGLREALSRQERMLAKLDAQEAELERSRGRLHKIEASLAGMDKLANELQRQRTSRVQLVGATTQILSVGIGVLGLVVAIVSVILYH